MCWLLWCIMYVMYVHIKAVTYVTFPNKTRFLTKVDLTEVQEEMSNTYLFLLYVPIMFVMYYIANWIWLWTKLVEKLIYACYPCICKYFRIKICLNQKGRKKPSLPCEKRITKTQQLWTNKLCHNALCIEIENDLWDYKLT